MLAERQGTKGLPEIEDEDRIERLVRFDGQHTFFFGNAVGETVCSHPVRSCNSSTICFRKARNDRARRR